MEKGFRMQVRTSRPANPIFSSKDLWRLIIPLIFEQLLAVSVGMIDTLMVSTVGEAAVSGVALVDNINRLMIQVLSAFATGGSVVCSQYYGSGQMERANEVCEQMETIMLLSMLTALVLLGCFSRPVLRVLFGSIEDDVMMPWTKGSRSQEV